MILHFTTLPLHGFAVRLPPSHQLARVWSLAIQTPAVFCALAIWWAFNASRHPVGMAQNLRPYQRHPLAAATCWITRLWFALDGMGLWMTMLTGILFPGTLVASAHHMFILLLLLETLAIGTLTILDLLGFYALFEASLIPMFLLIADGGSACSKVGAAYRIVTYTMAGSLVMLPMVFLIYDATGSTSLLHFNLSFDRQLLMWLGFLLVFGIKIPMIPVHLWLPEAHVAAPTAGSVLLAGLSVGSVIWLILRQPRPSSA